MPESSPQPKKRRTPGACDICKRKKIRCDSGAMPDNRCSNCVQFGFECTHREVRKALGPAKCYVESLEMRLEKMDKLFSKVKILFDCRNKDQSFLNRNGSQLLPGVDVNQEVDRIDREEGSIEADQSDHHDEDPAPVEALGLTSHLRKLSLNPHEQIFFGKSSGYQLVQTAIDLKQEYTGDTSVTIAKLRTSQRSEFWEIPQWAAKKNPELEEQYCEYVYPDADLIPSLIDAYFLHFNLFLPLLHRPTFEKSVAEGLHSTDSMFGATLLLVCAHGSRYSDDPRVFADGSDNPRSTGWKWFEQVDTCRTTFSKRTTLYELQMHALHILFAQSSEIPQGIWAQAGLALRLSQEVGAHRRKRKKDVPPSAEDELWKRAFWILLSLDRTISSAYGRPGGLNDEDFDLDLPLECDDEYWDNEFQQPPDKPSSITFFNCFLRLMDILAYAMRLIYSTRRPDDKIVNVPPRSEQQVIAQLDSAMNNWMDTVPSHLRWNPNPENTLFLQQSAVLHATYYNLQIFIHRPFIPSPRNTSRATYPSLAICTNAARSCCHVLEYFTRSNALHFSSLQITAFTAAVILLLNIWSGKRSGYAPKLHREMQSVQRCLEVLKFSEKRWASAGRYGDILRELASAGDLPILDSSQYQDIPRKKRPRDVDDIDPSDSSTSPPDSSSYSMESVSLNIPPYVLQQQPQQQHPLNFSLPMYSNELGRLPIYGQFQFSDSAVPCMPVQSSNGFVNPIPGQMGMSSNMQGAYAPNSSYEGQMMGNMVDHNRQIPATSSDFVGPLSTIGTAYDVNYSSPGFGVMPAMDNATMAVWSSAPNNFEMEDWRSYIHSLEQMTHAHGQLPT